MQRMHLAGHNLLIVILGPTAVGKTGFSIGLAQEIDAEIVSADSRQIYRHMDIGTAKPTQAEQQKIQHHLLDVVNPDENLSLAQYQKLANTAIRRIQSNNKIPLLVGGTGQYITAIVEGWSIPEVPPNPQLRSELEELAKVQGAEHLHNQLQTYDPVAAANIDYRNVRRVIRAIEVCIITGQPISQLQQKSPPGYNILHLGLTLDREILYQRADHRIDIMMKLGFLDEVKRLLGQGFSRRLPSMSGLGYAQLAAHLLDHRALDEMVTETKNITHDFIRRQYTWFRGHDPGIQWHDMTRTPPEIITRSVVNWVKEQI